MDEELTDTILEIIYDNKRYLHYLKACKIFGLSYVDYVAKGLHGEELVKMELERFKEYLDNHQFVSAIFEDSIWRK